MDRVELLRQQCVGHPDRLLCETDTLPRFPSSIMDNLKLHRVAAVKEKLKAAGLKLRYLPPYSPDLSPIEPAWSKIKTRLRTAAVRTREALDRLLCSPWVRVACTLDREPL